VLSSELDHLEWPVACTRAVAAFAHFLDHLKPGDRLDDDLHFEGQSLLRAIAEPVAQTPLPWEEAPEFALDLLWRTPAAVNALDHSLLPLLSWAPGAGQWALSCLDAAAETGPLLQRFGGALLMSATLQPLGETSARLGLPDPATVAGRGATVYVEGCAPWRAGAHRVAIDARVDTRFKQRGTSMRKTALTIEALTEGQAAPVVVFFSSYRYAEAVAQTLEWESPHLRVAVQPRRLDLAQQRRFLDESLLLSHALFLILGSSFAEGIDQLGGRVERAMVVGPALPEVNAVQEATREAFLRQGHQNPFAAAYQLPGMVRIHQALGRLVRAPGHKAEILLHGKRFAEPGYFELLRPEFQEASILRHDNDFAHWLENP
jgi:DNA excision repair protein ERCC-2